MVTRAIPPPKAPQRAIYLENVGRIVAQRMTKANSSGDRRRANPPRPSPNRARTATLCTPYESHCGEGNCLNGGHVVYNRLFERGDRGAYACAIVSVGLLSAGWATDHVPPGCGPRPLPSKHSGLPRSGLESVFARPSSGLVSRRASSTCRDLHEHCKSRSIIALLGSGPPRRSITRLPRRRGR